MAGRPPPRPTEAWIVRIGGAYLERYGSTVARFRRWIERRVRDAAREHGTDPAEAAPWIDAYVERLLRLGVLDDARFAASKARSLTRRGKSRRAIADQLRTAGVGADDLRAALTPEPEDGVTADPDLAAARTFARRHRLGAWRAGASDPDQRRKDLAKLGRKGFSYEVARRALEPEELTDDGPADRT